MCQVGLWSNDRLRREGSHFYHVSEGLFSKCHFAACVGWVMQSGFGLRSCVSVWWVQVINGRFSCQEKGRRHFRGVAWGWWRGACVLASSSSPLHLSKWEGFCLATAASLKGGEEGLLLIVALGSESLPVHVSVAPDERTGSLAWRAAWVASLCFILPQGGERNRPAACLRPSILRIWTPGCWSKSSTQTQTLFIFLCDICISASPPLKVLLACGRAEEMWQL